jgi:hypothetical protein
MNRTVLISSLIALLVLGIGCWAYGEMMPRNSIFSIGWLTFCWVSAALGVIQILLATALLLLKRAEPLRWQVFLSGLLWLLIGGAVCGLPTLF